MTRSILHRHLPTSSLSLNVLPPSKRHMMMLMTHPHISKLIWKMLTVDMLPASLLPRGYANTALHLAVARFQFLSEMQTVSTCLEWAKKMSHPTGIPLAEAHISETVAWIGYFSLIWCLLLRYNPSNCKQ